MALAWIRTALIVGGLGCAPMAYSAVDADDLLKRCAPGVHPDTMKAVLSTESRGHVLAVADAGPVALPWSVRKSMVRSLYPATLADAVALVKDLLAKGHTVSLGLAQINDRNLAAYGLAVEDVFEPCRNVATGAAILSDFYARAVKEFGTGQRALRAALSGYNSGSFVRGEQDGYVDLVYSQVGKPLVLQEGRAVPGGVVVPALSSGGVVPAGGWPKDRSAVKVAAAKRASGGVRDFTMAVSSFDGR